MCSLSMGVIFLVLGACRAGWLLQYFPRAVLTGIVGGIGVHLFVMGFEIVQPAARPHLEWETLGEQLFSERQLPLTMATILPAVVIYFTVRFKLCARLPWGEKVHEVFIPGIMVTAAALFWIGAAAAGRTNTDGLKGLVVDGWLFDVQGTRGGNATAIGIDVNSNINYWQLFDFSNVQWRALGAPAKNIVLVVLIGVVNLPVAIGALETMVPDVKPDVDRELLGSGVANLLAGAVGSLPTLIVFSYTRLFTMAGGGRLEGLLLSGVSIVMLFVAHAIIPYVPTMLASTLVARLLHELNTKATIGTLKTQSSVKGLHQTMSGMDNSEVDETTGFFTEPSPGRESQGVQVQDPKTVFHVNYRPDSFEKSRHRTASRNALNDLVIGTKGNRKFKKNITVVAEGTVMAHQTIDGQLAGSNEDKNNSSWFGTDEKHIFLKSTPCTFNVPAFQHGTIRLVKSDLINAINTAELKPVDSPSDSLDWVALQWATTEGVQDLFSDPTDLSENAREQLGDRLSDWLGDIGYSSNSLGALVSEGDVVRNYKQHADERPPSPVLHDWTDVYRTLSRRQKQGLSHDKFQVQESDGLSEVMSLVSYAESIFDAAATMSTASSVPGDAQELISKFVNLLIQSGEDVGAVSK
ncbi:hypothetical protein SLS63_004304 [Diaporthe eres]|uniref:SLC26A/SulP transporter domain-containing protein n=1 Tax=Diaporthe eres TaxID=83184 RepID=A0ABR1PEH4_DIAER